WFGASATAPLLTIDADRAARRIVRAIERRRSELTYTLPARAARRVHDWFPSLWRGLVGVMGRVLPRTPRTSQDGRSGAAEGRTIETASNSDLVEFVRRRGAPLAAKHGQYASFSAADGPGRGAPDDS